MMIDVPPAHLQANPIEIQSDIKSSLAPFHISNIIFPCLWTTLNNPSVFQGTCSGWIWAAYTHLDAQEGVA